MGWLLSSIDTLMDAGGTVLWAIMLLSLILWFLIIERFLFIYTAYPEYQRQWVEKWRAIKQKNNWRARNIRSYYISQAKLELGRNLTLIKTLIALCPMLGLLGTVTGMIATFDVMAVIGTGNARAMATGISSATVTTMAGMVIAISCLYFSKRIDDQVSEETNKLVELLTYDK